MDAAERVARDAWAALGDGADILDTLSFAGEGAFASRFAVDALAAGSVAAAGLALAATARLLVDLGRVPPGPGHAPPAEADLAPEIERTAWGPARRLRPPLAVDGAPIRRDRPVGPLGAEPAAWG